MRKHAIRQVISGPPIYRPAPLCSPNSGTRDADGHLLSLTDLPQGPSPQTDYLEGLLNIYDDLR
jgi:hypothetical protein